ncbi:MAG: Crp/Fnr family transcriptional regulator [Flaviramulus sp.]|nr:Crp/Fnr family transcriptional regulator [Flaviramulus sp.]NNC50760.1 Crp/Fnr family transcriptional regulator [Flaviramulus sp.]
MNSVQFESCFKSILKSDFFSDIPTRSINELLNNSALENWPKKTCFISNDNIQNKFHVLISGQIKAYNYDFKNDRRFTLFLLKENDLFDVFSLYKKIEHNIHYEALKDSLILSIPVYKMKQWVLKNPSINTGLMAYTLNRILVLENFINDVVLENTFTRLTKLFLKYLDKSTKKFTMINDLSHDELAQLIGTTRAVLNRHIQVFKDEGIIEVGRNSTQLKDYNKLLSMANSF